LGEAIVLKNFSGYKNPFFVVPSYLCLFIYACLFREVNMGRAKPDRKAALKKLILTLLTPREVWRLRDRYNQGEETIMDLSQKSGCPPVLLYSVLTPLRNKTAIKLRMLRLEQRIYFMVRKGLRTSEIAKELNLEERVVREYSEDQYEPAVVLMRAWYNDRHPKPPDPNEVVYDERTLPPTSRLGWSDGVLTDIPPERKGRCPTCGHMVSLPCLACRVREDMRTHRLPAVEEYDDSADDDIREPELLFN
jgi:hypothetical protein